VTSALPTWRSLDGIDALTGLPGAAAAEYGVEQVISQGDEHPALVALVEIDDLSSVDDHIGAGSSDAVLFMVADRLREALPPGTFLCRVNDWQFLAAIPGVSSMEALDWAEILRSAGESPVFIGELELVTDVAVGLAHVTIGGLEASSVIAQAGVALGRARSAPSRSLVLPVTDGRLPARFRLLDSFAAALRRGRGLDLHYQSQWSLPDVTMVGTEALIRWTTPDGVKVSPAEFIPTVEKTPMISNLTRWILERAARDSRWLPEAVPRVAVNVSARCLADPHFVHEVTAGFAPSGEPDLSRLELEITETALMSAPVRARQNLVALRELGLTVALDDFGTGYSSLGLLRTLPVDTIKIDQSFVIGVEQDPTARRLICGIVDLAHALDLTVVAEGIETEAALDIVSESGCDIGQGYYLGRPAPPTDSLLNPHFGSAV